MEASTNDYWLGRGPHATPDEGRCAMEWVSYLAGEAHSDRPTCVSPALRSFCVSLNDGLGQRERQRLRPYLTRTIGTADDCLDDERAWMAMDWLVRVYAPAWLDLAGVEGAARTLAALRALHKADDLPGSLAALEKALPEARAARAAAARGSTLARLSLSAERSGRRAARASGRSALWVVVRIAIGGEAGDAASTAARAAAGEAAAAVARSARARATRATAKDAVSAAIGPTVDALRHSSFALLDRMLPTQPGAGIVARESGAEKAPLEFADLARAR